MKRLTTALIYGLIAALGLIWAIGCTSSSNGPGNNTPLYRIQLQMSRPSMHNLDPSDTVNCWVLNYQTSLPISGAQLRFATKSHAVNPGYSVITPAATSDTVGTGTNPRVIYSAYAVPDSLDIIYAYLLTNNSLDTLMMDSTTVVILH